MYSRAFVVLIACAALGRAQSDDPKNAKRIGDLLIEATSVNTPLTIGPLKSEPPTDHYWVSTELTFRNVGQRPVCADFGGSLKAEFGLSVSNSLPNVTIPELLPGEEIHGSLVFALRRGAIPLEFTVAEQIYGVPGCGNELPPSAIRTATFSVQGVSSPPPLPANPPNLSSAAGISKPVPIYQPAPEYSKEALKAKLQGSVLLSLIVDATGKPSSIEVTKSLGLGLDEKAIEAVQKWRFKPAMKDGKPVPVIGSIEVNFRLPLR